MTSAQRCVRRSLAEQRGSAIDRRRWIHAGLELFTGATARPAGCCWGFQPLEGVFAIVGATVAGLALHPETFRLLRRAEWLCSSAGRTESSGGDASPGERIDVCDHCGCRELTPVARLMAEHDRLRELTALIRRDLSRGADERAGEHLRALLVVLGPHVMREESRLFPVLRRIEELREHVDALEAEHADLYDDVDTLDELDTVADRRRGVLRILDDLGEHMFKEDFGLFPAALAALDGVEWDAMEDAEPARARAGRALS